MRPHIIPGAAVSARLSLSLSIALLLAAVGDAQQFDRRARDEPEVVIEAGGRVGTADALQFTPDGNYLLAGGDDKVVRVWPYSATGLDTSPARARVLRWRGWRDQLGGIKCLAPSPDGKRVAVGGYGLKVSSVAVLDRETGATAAITWPRVREGNYHDAVTAVAFHPDGKRVGFGTADGTLWFWDPVRLAKPEGDRVWNAPVCAGRFENPEPDALNLTHGLRFTDDSTLVAVSQRGQVLACDLKGPLSDDPAAPVPQGRTLFGVYDGVEGKKYPVNHAEWSGDGQWLVAVTKGPLVLLRSADGKKTVRLDLPAEHFARSLAVHPRSGKVAIGVGAALPGTPRRPRFYMEPDDQIWVYDQPTAAKPRDPKKHPHAGRAEAMAFHPTENRLAVAGGDADEVTLLDLAAMEKPLSVVRGTGRRMYGLSLSENGEVFAVRCGRNVAATDPNDRGNGVWARFNLTRFTPTADGGGNWLGPLSTAGDWEVVPDVASRFVWYAERQTADGKNERLKLLLDPDRDQAPTCYTFVPTAEGKPPRVLVGHYYGCSLFELDPARAVKDPGTGALELARSKLFVGHGAEVNAVVADKKGAWFLTAGSDQTVAAWGLHDWKAQEALGATFAAKDGQLVVGPVDVASPAWEAGLTEGDRLELVATGGKVTYDRRAKRPPVGTPEAAAAALARPQSGVELFFGWVTAQGERRATPTRVKQRPLWKWFPSFDDRGRIADSVLWMWHGSYYYTASVHGDRMVGWHVNAPEVTGTPDFQPLERYKQMFLKPNVITKLISTRSVGEALKEASGENAMRRPFREVEAAPVDLAIKSGVVRPDGVKLTLSVTPRGNNPDQLPDRVELWVNDYRYRTWAGRGKQAIQEDVLIPADVFRAGDNQVTALVLNPLRGRAEATGYVHNPAKPIDPRLTGFAVGINNYAAHREAVAGVRSFGDLRKARADADALSRELLRYRGPGKFFPEGKLPTLLDSDAGRKGIMSSLSDLKDSDVRPDDMLVVFFAGHGDLLAAPNKGLPREFLAARGLPADSGLFVFCCPDYSPTNSTATAVTGEEVFEALAAINCRKFVLLDACHAGGALETNVVRRLIPHGQGPVVIAACDQHELAVEDEKLGHGVFTYAVLEALGSKFRGADANSDGTLTPAELYDYLADRVPALVQSVQPGHRQHPICFPQPGALPKVALIRK